MTQRRQSRRMGAKAVAATAVALGLAASAAVLIAWPDGKQVAIDPAAIGDLKQAALLAKQGSWTESAQLIETHLTTDNPQAKLEYALLLTRGWGVERDLERARQLLLQAVAYDFPKRGRAAFELGRLYKAASGEDCTRIAFEWFMKSAGWDYTKAHLELGKAFRKGLGVVADADQAMKHYRIAAASGSAAAIWSMIEMAEKGTAVSEPNLERARVLAGEYLPRLEAEARGGNAYAARSLARLCLKGTVLQRDTGVASRWLREAAGLGDPAAMHDLARLMMKGGDGSQEADAVLDLMRESARRGYGGAMTALGRLHLKQAYGLTREEAVVWLRRGTDAGHAGAMEELARLHLNGVLVESDLSEAERLARMGAKLRHDGAIRLLEEIQRKTGETAETAGDAESKTRG